MEDFCVFLTDLEALHARIDGISEAFNQVEEHYALMTEQNVSFPEHQKAEYQSLSLEYANLKSLIDIADSNKSDNIQKFTVKLEGIVKTLKDTTQARLLPPPPSPPPPPPPPPPDCSARFPARVCRGAHAAC